MRMKKAWIVARKDLSEFRANRTILLQLSVFPIFMIIVPTMILVPIASLAVQPSPKEPALPFDPSTLRSFPPAEYADVSFSYARLNDSTIVTSTLNHTYVSNSTLRDVVVHDSLLDNVTVVNGILIDSILRNSQYSKDSTVLLDTVTSGTTKGQTEDLKALFPLFTHGVLLLLFFMMAVGMPTAIAAYSFVGEKSNKTLEPLLATPLTDAELLWGKYLAVFVPVMALILAAFAAFAVIVDVITAPTLGYILIPDPTWIIGIFVITPLICLIGISINVLISSKVNDVRTAQQYSALIVFPLLMALLGGGLLLTVSLSLSFLSLAALALLGLMALLVWLSLRVFNREEVITSWK